MIFPIKILTYCNDNNLFWGEEAGHFLLGGKLLPLKYRTLPAGMFAAFLFLKMPSTVYACKLLVEKNV